MSEQKYIRCTHCKNIVYCLETGEWRFNLPENPCVDAEPVDSDE